MISNSYYIIGFFAIPLMSIFIVQIPKKKHLWLLPFISLILFAIWTVIVFPEIIFDSPNVAGADSQAAFVMEFWLRRFVPFHIFLSLIATVIAYVMNGRKNPENDKE